MPSEILLKPSTWKKKKRGNNKDKECERKLLQNFGSCKASEQMAIESADKTEYSVSSEDISDCTTKSPKAD